MAGFQRLSRLFRGVLGQVVTQLEEGNPRALREAEKAALQEAVCQYNQRLAAQAALVESLRTQAEKTRSRADKLKARITPLVQAQQLEEAGKLALEARNLAGEAAAIQGQMEAADREYRDLTQQRDVYVREARRRLDKLPPQ